jgi:rhamnosyl/mannosyltransferase
MRRIVVPSPQLMRTSPILAAHGEKCAVVPFGVAAENFRLTPEIAKAAVALRERLVGDASRGVVFLFVGKFRYYKGLPVLLEAFRRLASRVPAARLLLVGDGPEKSALQAEASRSGLAHCVHFAGPLSDGELVACYHACDVLVLPSVKRSEAFGLVLLEAMACGKPVVSTELGTATSWVNQTERTGLVVPPGDAAALEHALERLARNASLRAALGENAGARIRAHFQPKHMFDGICSQYELTCSVPSPARKQKQSVTTSVGELHR